MAASPGLAAGIELFATKAASRGGSDQAITGLDSGVDPTTRYTPYCCASDISAAHCENDLLNDTLSLVPTDDVGKSSTYLFRSDRVSAGADANSGGKVLAHGPSRKTAITLPCVCPVA